MRLPGHGAGQNVFSTCRAPHPAARARSGNFSDPEFAVWPWFRAAGTAVVECSTDRYTVWVQSPPNPVVKHEGVPRKMSGSDGASDVAVRYEATDSGVAILTFNRPERLNAWGPDLAAGFYAAVDRAEQDPDVRVT